MKRSEMVEIIKGAFKGSQNLGSDLAMASYILDKIEDRGMLPPDDIAEQVVLDNNHQWDWEPEK